MKLINDDPKEEHELPAPDEPPALDPPEAERAGETARHETQRASPPLIRWIVAAVIIIIIALLILLFARWIYHKAHHSQPATVTGTSASRQSSDLNTKSGQGQPGGSSTGAGSTGAGPNANTSLPNNGPGNVMGLFVISTAAGAGLHYAIRSRRLNG